MDTRTKILTANEARERLKATPATWVSGSFDPLLAGHVRRLNQLRVRGEPLVVEIAATTKPLMPQRARAELVAALSVVDYVVLSDELSAPEDADLTSVLVQHVLRRSGKETAG